MIGMPHDEEKKRAESETRDSRGSGMARIDSGIGSAGDFLQSVTGRAVMVLVSAVLGGVGSIGYLQQNPSLVREHPWTSLDAARANNAQDNKIAENYLTLLQLQKEVSRLSSDISRLEGKDALFESDMRTHLIRGEAGFAQLEQLRADMNRCMKDLNEHDRVR